jgi:hypothetical protein
MRTLLILSLLSALAFAQQDGATGTVTGHVYCADTQHPARFARIALVPLPPAVTSPSAAKPTTPQQYTGETRSDGSFLVTHVPPGDYFVSVTYPGYLSPEYQFSADDLLQPSADVRKRILETIPTLGVAANKSASVSVTLHRGSGISGILRYDDGSPVPDVEIVPLDRDSAGHWVEIPRPVSDNSLLENGGSDDLGHFRIRGLAPGEYTLKIGRWAEGQDPFDVYYGDAFLEKDAKSIKLADGEEYSGADITIRLSKLHTISGSLLNVSGQPINSGQISLYTVAGDIKVASAFVDEDEAVFHVDLVPEGHYTLRVTEVRDENVAVVRDTKDPNQISDIKRTVLQTYADYQAPLEVTSDITGLNLTILAKPK